MHVPHFCSEVAFAAAGAAAVVVAVAVAAVAGRTAAAVHQKFVLSASVTKMKNELNALSRVINFMI